MKSRSIFNFNKGCQVTYNEISNNNNCTIYTGARQEKTTTEDAQPCLDTYITVGFREKRKPEYEHALSVIMDSKWSDKDRARFALVLYESTNMIPNTKPTTFNQWYQIFCDIFNFPYHKDYTPTKLKGNNEAIQALQMYM